jgi:hypothetical protein
MKTFLVFTGTGPVLFLSSFDTLDDPRALEKFRDKGITKFIAYEVDVNVARQRYGLRFDRNAADLEDAPDIRVLDYDGSHAFRQFSFNELGREYRHEE